MGLLQILRKQLSPIEEQLTGEFEIDEIIGCWYRPNFTNSLVELQFTIVSVFATSHQTTQGGDKDVSRSFARKCIHIHPLQLQDNCSSTV